MSIQLIQNGEKCHLDYVKKLMSSFDEIYVLVAFFKNTGLREVKDIFTKNLKTGVNINIIVGLDMYVTEPSALYGLHNLLPKNGSVHFYLYKSRDGSYHPKIYSSKNINSYQCIVGSANLTGSGLKKNIEASIYCDAKDGALIHKDIKSMFIDISSKDSCSIADVISISQYERQYDVYKANEKKSNLEVEKQLKKIFNLNLGKLSDLQEYLEDVDQQVNWKNKVKNYKQAKKVLNKLRFAKNKKEFLTLYEMLVGAKGKGQLWHSGSMFRSKNQVAIKYKKFIAMLNAIYASAGLPSDVVFSVAAPFVNEIKGLGNNVVTEIFNTLKPKKHPVLNNNPIESIKHLGFFEFKLPSSFNSVDYAEYSKFMKEFSERLEFKDLSQVDHFLNYVFWKYKLKK